MKFRKFSVLILGLVLSPLGTPLFAQQSLFESHDGDTSIFLDGGKGVIGTNVGKTDIRFSFLHEILSRQHRWSWGADVAGELKGTSAQLFNGVTPAKSGSLRAGAKRRFIFTRPPNASVISSNSAPAPCRLCDDWIVFQAGYQRSQIRLIDTSRSPLPTPTSHGFDGYLGRAAYNALVKTSKHNFLLGASVGLSRTNNTEDLKSVQVTDSQVTVSNGVERRAAKDTVAAFVGTYKKFIGVPINADAIWYPGALSGRIGFDAFVRSQVAAVHRSATPGLGIFFCKAGQPTRPIGGATISYKDGKGKTVLVAGWNF